MEEKITLSKKDRREIVAETREELKKQLDGVPKGTRIVFKSTETLEDLIFDYYDLELPEVSDVKDEYRGKKIRVKCIALEGKYLRKLDLSKVSFEDVVWGRFGFINKGRNFNFQSDQVDLSGTNAKIDFSVSSVKKYLNTPLEISNCNFSGLDLSNNFLDSFCILNCNFAETNINLIYPDSLPGSSRYAVICNSIMDGLRTFSEWPCVSYFSFANGSIGYNAIRISGCSLKNTGLKISLPQLNSFKFDVGKLTYVDFFNKFVDFNCDEEGNIVGLKYNELLKNELEKNRYSEYSQLYYKGVIQKIIHIYNLICQGNLLGCYINGVEIASLEDARAKMAKSMK